MKNLTILLLTMLVASCSTDFDPIDGPSSPVEGTYISDSYYYSEINTPWLDPDHEDEINPTKIVLKYDEETGEYIFKQYTISFPITSPPSYSLSKTCEYSADEHNHTIDLDCPQGVYESIYIYYNNDYILMCNSFPESGGENNGKYLHSYLKRQ